MYLSNSQMLRKSLVLLKDKIGEKRKDKIWYGNQCFRKEERTRDQKHEKTDFGRPLEQKKTET